MKAEYIQLITERDAILSTLRAFWVAARTPAERAPHMARINASLDERLRLMRLRDAAAN